jgi:hypothetical protein
MQLAGAEKTPEKEKYRIQHLDFLSEEDRVKKEFFVLIFQKNTHILTSSPE